MSLVQIYIHIQPVIGTLILIHKSFRCMHLLVIYVCSINKSKIGQMDIIMNENEVLVHDFLFSFEDFQKVFLTLPNS